VLETRGRWPSVDQKAMYATQPERLDADERSATNDDDGPNGDSDCPGPDGDDLPCFPCFAERGEEAGR